jgi:hypothetical protein
MNGYAEDIERYNHPMVLPKTFNGMTIQVEWLSHNHPMVMPKIFNGITIQLQVE